MTRALLVYESMFGNTRSIAEAVADGLRSCLPTELAEVGVAPTWIPEDVTLVVVGGPTHALGLSRPQTRQDAATRTSGPLVSPEIGLREWLIALNTRDGVPAATFDTRIGKPRVPGSAARAAGRRLRRAGFRLVVPAKSFYVSEIPGPLLEGELDRAREWGEDLARQAQGMTEVKERVEGGA